MLTVAAADSSRCRHGGYGISCYEQPVVPCGIGIHNDASGYRVFSSRLSCYSQDTWRQTHVLRRPR